MVNAERSMLSSDNLSTVRREAHRRTGRQNTNATTQSQKLSVRAAADTMSENSAVCPVKARKNVAMWPKSSK